MSLISNYAVSTAVYMSSYEKLPELFSVSIPTACSVPSPFLHTFLSMQVRCKIFFKSQPLNGCAFLNPTYNSHENINSWKGEHLCSPTLYMPSAIDHHLIFCWFCSQKEGLQRFLKPLVLMDYFIKGCHIIEHIPSALGHVPTTCNRPLFLVLSLP